MHYPSFLKQALQIGLCFLTPHFTVFQKRNVFESISVVYLQLNRFYIDGILRKKREQRLVAFSPPLQDGDRQRRGGHYSGAGWT